MQPNDIIAVLNRPISQELLARDATRLAYVAKDETPRTSGTRDTGSRLPSAARADPEPRRGAAVWLGA